MTRSPLSRGAIAVTAAATLLVGPAVTSAAAAPQGTQRHTQCTITEGERASLLDARAALRAQLAGHHLTKTEKAALHAAVRELVVAARDTNLAPEVRAAKKAELAALRATLEVTTSATERTAIRAEIQAIRLELQQARLTHAQRKAIAQQAKAMRAALRDRPTKAERRAIRAQVAVITAKLACRTVAGTVS